MKAKRQVAITVETREKTIIHFEPGRTTIFCESCRSDTLHLAVAETAGALAVSEQSIDGMVKTHQIHSLEGTDGSLLICANSLAILTNK